MNEKAMMDRLRAMQLRDKGQAEESYDDVDKDGFRREPQGLPVAVVEQWQESVLEDPKNR
jgi:hypothetical protein